MRVVVPAWIFVIAFAVALPGRPLRADGPTTRPDPAAAVLPKLPADAEAAGIIAKLGANSSATLPAATIVGEFGEIAKAQGLDRNGPKGRDFTIKMAWSADRKRAFFCGANHGVPHKLNDVWEYDLAANAWICQWDPDFNSRYKPGERGNAKADFNADGILATPRGGPVAASHTWWGLTYDPVRRQMQWMSRTNYRGEGEGKGWPVLFAFDPYARRWRLSKVPAARGGFQVPGQAMEYIPDLKGSIWWANRSAAGQMYLLDSASGAWSEVEHKGGRENYPAGFDATMVYDPDSKVLVVRGGRGTDHTTFHFDVPTLTWSKVGEQKDVPRTHDNFTLMGYDPVARACLMVDQKSNTIWSYAVKERAWKKLPVNGPPMPESRYTGYFDPARNVFVLIHRRNVWVYRNQPASE